MGLCFDHRRRARALPVLAVLAVLTALFTAAATQVASAAGGKPPSGGGQPPCPSCPDRTPPVGGNPPSSGTGSGPTAVPAQPLFSLASITGGGNGTATVTGSVNLNADANVSGGSASGNLQLAVNGRNVGISAAGNFSATTNLAANGGVTVQADDASAGVTCAITIPSAAIPSSGVAANALVQLNKDKVTLMLPADGFDSVDGNSTTATVHVGSINGIAQLSLNGTNLLAQLQAGASAGSGSGNSGSGNSGPSGSGSKPGGVKPGGGSPPASHSASAPVSGSAKHVKLTVTATNGAKQTTSVRIQRIRSVIRFGRLASISAFGARGIRISRITFNRSALRSSGRLGIAVTVQDRGHYLIRDAVVMLQPSSQRTTIRSSWVRMSNALGRATFSVPVSSSSLGHRLYVRVIAQTPLSKTHVTASTFLSTCGC